MSFSRGTKTGDSVLIYTCAMCVVAQVRLGWSFGLGCVRATSGFVWACAVGCTQYSVCMTPLCAHVFVGLSCGVW